MSFDLIVLVPTLSREIAERFNCEAHSALPEGMRFDTDTCGEASPCWEVHHEGEVWAEMYPGPSRARFDGALSQRMEGLPHQLHFPNRAHPLAFYLAADVAEAAGGVVFDPQCVAEEFADALGDDLTADARQGVYSPALTRRVAEEIRRADG